MEITFKDGLMNISTTQEDFSSFLQFLGTHSHGEPTLYKDIVIPSIPHVHKDEEKPTEVHKDPEDPDPVAETVEAVVHEPVTDEKKSTFVNLVDVCKHFQRTSTAIYRWVKLGLPCKRMGNRLMFDVEECDAWVKGHINLKFVPYSKNPKVPKSVETKEPDAKEKASTSFLTGYGAWQKKVFAKIREKNLDCGMVCSETYKYMTRVYGIVWDQVKKDYRAATGLYSPPSTLYLAYWLQTSNHNYKNLFDNSLDAVIQSA